MHPLQALPLAPDLIHGFSYSIHYNRRGPQGLWMVSLFWWCSGHIQGLCASASMASSTGYYSWRRGKGYVLWFLTRVCFLMDACYLPFHLDSCCSFCSCYCYCFAISRQDRFSKASEWQVKTTLADYLPPPFFHLKEICSCLPFFFISHFSQRMVRPVNYVGRDRDYVRWKRWKHQNRKKNIL